MDMVIKESSGLTNTYLAACRQEGDAFIDNFVGKLLKENGREALVPILNWCKDNKTFETDSLPVELLSHFESFSILPEFADIGKMEAGFQFFKKYVAPIAMLLGCYSLPYCYAGADGAQVLYFSEKIHQNTTQRLNDTGDFVREMHVKANWDNGSNYVRAYKVRLMHGIIRAYLQNSPKWDAAWGLPLNQEDKAGTNLAFSYIVLIGLGKLGFDFSEKEAESYLHTWKVIGYFMGVNANLLVDTMAEASKLDVLIAGRNFRESEVGKYLTKALIESSRGVIKIPFLKNMPTAIMREMLGDDMADMMEIPHLPVHQKFIKRIPFKFLVRNSRVIKAEV